MPVTCFLSRSPGARILSLPRWETGSERALWTWGGCCTTWLCPTRAEKRNPPTRGQGPGLPGRSPASIGRQSVAMVTSGLAETARAASSGRITKLGFTRGRERTSRLSAIQLGRSNKRTLQRPRCRGALAVPWRPPRGLVAPGACTCVRLPLPHTTVATHPRGPCTALGGGLAQHSWPHLLMAFP